jgi:hypothetical protein
MEFPDPDLQNTLKQAELAWQEFNSDLPMDSSDQKQKLPQVLLHEFMAVLLAGIERIAPATQFSAGPLLDLVVLLRAGLSQTDPCPALLSIGHIHEHLRSSSMPFTANTGRVYTPLQLVREMLNELLADLKPVQSTDDCSSLKLPRLLDPACGCGAFLLGAAQAMLERCLDNPQPGSSSQQADPGSLQQLRRRIVEQVLHGCDSDADALAVCNALLSYWASGSFHDSSLQLKLRHANALSGPAPGSPASMQTEPAGLDWVSDTVLGQQHGAYDYILGNPPYIDSESMSRQSREFRKFARRTYYTARGNWDIYVLFFERCLALLKPNGRLSLVVPARSLCADYAAELQELFLEHQLERVRLLNPDLFPAARIWPVVIQLRREDGSSQQEPVRLQQGLPAREHLVEPGLLQRLPAGYLAAAFSAGAGYIVELLEKAPALSSLVSCSDGCSTAEAYRLVGLIVNGAEETGFRLLNTGTIDPYTSLWGRRECRYLGKRYLHPVIDGAELAELFPRRAVQAGSPKLLIAGLSGRIECLVDPDGSNICGKAAVQLIPRSPELDLYLLCGLLNSSLLNWLYRSLFGLRGYSGRAMNIGPRQLELLPIIAGSASERISRIALQLSRLEPGTDVLQDPRQAELDELVLRMYGVDAKLRGIIGAELRG